MADLTVEQALETFTSARFRYETELMRHAQGYGDPATIGVLLAEMMRGEFALIAAAERRGREQAEADNQRLREAQGWQPIETAPKDGTRVIAWGPQLMVAECEYRRATFIDPAGWYRSNQHPRVEPTHWQPLPPAPVGVPRG